MSKSSVPKSEILNEPDRGLSKARSPLARLFRKVLDEMRITPLQWKAMMANYLENPKNREGDTGSDINSVRGNLNKELKKPWMTMKVFMKAVRFLAPKSARLELHMTWHDNRTTIHGVPLLDDEDTLMGNAPNTIDQNLNVLKVQTVTGDIVPLDMEELIRRVREAKEAGHINQLEATKAQPEKKE